MAYTTPTTAVAGVPYPSADLNIIVDDIIYLYNQRPLAGFVYSSTDWSPSAADWTFETDTDANAKVDVTLIATSTIIAVATVRVTSNTARDEAVAFRFTCSGSTSDSVGYAGFPNADYRIMYPVLGAWSGKTAGTYSIQLQAAQAESDDNITIEDRYIAVFVIPE